MRGAIFLPAVVILAPQSAEAQAIRGIVVEESARLPVPGVRVELLAANRPERSFTLTDSLGAFVLAVPRAGTYALRFSHPSYVAYETAGVEVGTGETVSIEVRLGRNVVPLEPLVVTVRGRARLAGFDERRRAGLGRFLTREEIEARGAAKTTDLLRGMPGVSISLAPRRRSSSIIAMNGGFGRCFPAVWIDGTLVEQHAESTPDDVLAPEDIEAVEVYTSFSAAPPQFISGSCGVVMFWTRHGANGEDEPWSWTRLLAGAGAAALLILLIR